MEIQADVSVTRQTSLEDISFYHVKKTSVRVRRFASLSLSLQININICCLPPVSLLTMKAQFQYN